MLQVLGNKARRKCQTVPFLRMCRGGCGLLETTLASRWDGIRLSKLLESPRTSLNWKFPKLPRQFPGLPHKIPEPPQRSDNLWWRGGSVSASAQARHTGTQVSWPRPFLCNPTPPRRHLKNTPLAKTPPSLPSISSRFGRGSGPGAAKKKKAGLEPKGPIRLFLGPLHGPLILLFYTDQKPPLKKRGGQKRGDPPFLHRWLTIPLFLEAILEKLRGPPFFPFFLWVASSGRGCGLGVTVLVVLTVLEVFLTPNDSRQWT